MAYNYEYPYTDPHRHNDDWLINKVKELSLSWIATVKEWNSTKEEFRELKSYIMNYFSELDVQEEINHKLETMASDGTLSTIIQPLFNAYKSDIDNELSALKSRMNSFTSLADGSTTGDAELIDGRVDFQGVTHENIGENIRVSCAKISGELDEMDTLSDLVGEIGGFWINHYSHERTPGESYISSEYIRVKAGQSYFITAINQTGNEYSTTLNLYDMDKVWVNDSRGDMDNAEWVAPIDGYIIVTNYGEIKPVCKSVQNHVVKDIASMRTELDAMKSTHDLVVSVGNFYINRNSKERINTGNYLTSEFIEVKAGEVYTITAGGQDGNRYDTSVILYNTAKEYTGHYTRRFDGEEWTARVDGYIIVSRFGKERPICQHHCNHIMKEISKIVNMEKIVSNVDGKTLIWFGTSIPDGSYSNNYPSMVGEILNCTVINNALGSSTARTGIASRVTADEPMGIKHVSWKIGTRCLTQTLAEKQSIIDEWETKWGANGTMPFSGAPDTLTEQQKSDILDSTFELRLTPYLDGTYPMPDVFIFDHGWNDGAYEQSEEMSTIPVDDNDRHYFIGAMNYLIRMILSANPTAKILLIGHFENDERPRVNNAQEKLADIWGFPLLKLWEISGISTKEITVNGQVTTTKLVYCPDGIHPHSDETGRTNAMLAGKIAKWIASVV